MVDYLNYGKQTQQSLSPTKDELLQLFPVPVLIAHYPFDFSKEFEWIKNLKMRNEENIKGVAYNDQSQDTFVLEKQELATIRQFIEVKLNEYVVNIMGAKNKMVLTQSWVNKSKKGEFHQEHSHPNSIISGVWYPKINEKLPPIEFIKSDKTGVNLSFDDYNMFTNERFMIPLKNGELILFPSNLSHCVSPNQCDEERISLSFNTWSTNSLGDKKRLTYLPCYT